MKTDKNGCLGEKSLQLANSERGFESLENYCSSAQKFVRESFDGIGL